MRVQPYGQREAEQKHDSHSVAITRSHARSTPREKIACVVIPNFLIEVCQRDHPRLNRPLALADSDLDSAEIIAINQPAADAGLLLRITVAQGHILCPNLIVMVRDTERELEESNAVYKKLQSLSPFVEEALPGLYFLDASGFDWLYQNDHRYASKIITALQSYGPPPYPCQIGIARNKFVAQVAANQSATNHSTIVPHKNEKSFLRPLALAQLQTDSLRLSSDTLDSLHDLGLKTIGQAATFPANEMIRRFGPQGEILSRLARGEDPDFFTPEAVTELLTDTIWLDHPTACAETIIRYVKRMLVPLLTKLGRYHQGCSTLEIIGHLDRRQQRTIPLSITVERPTLAVKTFLRQLRTTLEEKQKKQEQLLSPLNGLTVTIPVTSALVSEQLPLGDKLSTNSSPTEPISNLSPMAPITTPTRLDFFLPEQRFSFPGPTAQPKTKPPGYQSHWPHQSSWSHQSLYARGSITGLRLRPTPRDIEVTRYKNMPLAINQTPITSTGPWELSGHWWSNSYSRHYWEIQTAALQHYLIYHDLQTDRWFLQGVFD